MYVMYVRLKDLKRTLLFPMGYLPGFYILLQRALKQRT